MDEYHQYGELVRRQKINGLTLKDVTIVEGQDAPADTDYIVVYTGVDNMIVKDIAILKDQKEPNGCLIRFKEEGCIDTLVAQQIFTKGLKEMISDESKVKTYLPDTVIRG